MSGVNTLEDVQAGRGPDDPTSIPPVAAAAPDDPWGKAMGALMLAIANADRTLRRQPPVASVLDIHPKQGTRYHASGLLALLEQYPSATLEALNDAGEELREFVEGLLNNPDAAIVSDPERMKDACVAMVRKILGAYRTALVMQLTVLRSPEAQG